MTAPPPNHQYIGPAGQQEYPPPYNPYPPQQPPQQMDQKAGPPMVGQPQPPNQYNYGPPQPQPQPQAFQYNSPTTIVMNQPQSQPAPTTTVIVQEATQPPIDRGTKNLATCSLVAAIIATVCCAGFLITVPAIVLAALALSERHSQNAKGMAVASCILTVLAWVAYVVCIIWIIVASTTTSTCYNSYTGYYYTC